MNFNAAALRLMLAKGLSLGDVVEIAEANERRSDPTAADRMRRYRERKSVTRNVTRNAPPNDNSNPPVASEAKAASSPHRAKFPPPPNVSDGIWADFLASPKRRKAGMSKTAYAGIKNNLAELAEHGFPPGDMVALAVERGWTTIKLEWVQNDERSQTYRRSPDRLGRNQSPDGLSPTTRAALAVFGAPSTGH